MSKLPDWIVKDSKAVVLEEISDTLKPLADVAEKWNSIVGKLLDLGKDTAPIDTPVKLVDFILANLDDADVKKVLVDIDKDLAADLAKLKTDFEDSKWRKLLKPVGDLTEQYKTADGEEGRYYNEGTDEGLIRVSVPKAEASAKKAAGNLDLTFDLSAEAHFDIEAGSVWPFQSDDVPGGLLRIGTGGNLAGKAGAKLPIQPWGAIAAGAKAEGQSHIGYFFRPTKHETFLGAAEPALTGLANPFNLQALANSMQNGGLEGFTFFVSGAAEAKVLVTLGRDFAIADLASGNVGITGSVKFTRASKWVLSLRKNGAQYDVVLSRLKASGREWSVGSSLSVDVSGLTQKVDHALTKAMEQLGPQLEQIKPFLSPGTHAAEKLDDLLGKAAEELAGDSTLMQAVVAAIGLLTGDEAEKSLAVEKWLWEELASAIDDVSGGVTAKAPDFTKEVLDKVAAKLPEVVPSKIKTSARTAVNDLVTKLLAEWDDLEKDLTKNRELTRKLAKELGAIGIEVKQAKNTAKDEADKALAGVRELVEKYEKFTKKLHETVKEAAEKQIGLQLGYQKEQSTKASYEVIGHFTDVSTDGAQELWHQMMLGKLQGVQEMIVNPAQKPDGFELHEDSAIALSSSSSEGFKVTLDFLGKALSFSKIASGEATVGYENGVVTVHAEGKVVVNESGWDGTSREGKLLSVYDLKQFADGNESRTMSLVVDLVRKDRNLREAELKAFLRGLGDHGLVSQERIKTAVNLLQEAKHDNGSGTLSGDVKFVAELSPRQVSNMLELGKLIKPDNAVHRECFVMAFNLLREFEMKDQRNMDNALGRAYELSDGNVTDYLYKHRRKLPHEAGLPGLGASRNTNAPLQRLLDLANDFPNMLQCMADIYNRIPQFGTNGGWTEKDYAKAEQRLADSAKDWLKLRKTFKTDMHPVMLALLRIFARLDGDFTLSEADELGAAIRGLGTKPSVADTSDFIVLSLTLGGGEAKNV